MEIVASTPMDGLVFLHLLEKIVTDEIFASHGCVVVHKIAYCIYSVCMIYFNKSEVYK